MNWYRALLFAKTATIFDKLAFRRLSREVETGVVVTMGYRRNRGTGAAPAIPWLFVDVEVNARKVWKSGRGIPLLRRSRRAVSCPPGMVDIAVREGLPGRPTTPLDRVNFDLAEGELLHVKIVPDLNGPFGGLISSHGINIIQRSINGSLVAISKSMAK